MYHNFIFIFKQIDLIEVLVQVDLQPKLRDI